MKNLLPNPKTLTGILIAGGKSTRMGSPKANLPLGNETFGEKALHLLQQFCGQIIISQNEPLIDSPFATVSDIYPDIGPMGGLHAGLSASHTLWNLVIACDMPQLLAQTITPLLKHCRNHQAVCYTDNGFGEPLCAIYNRQALVEIEKCIASQNYSLQKLLQKLDTNYLPVNDLIRSQLRNINTPADFMNIHQ